METPVVRSRGRPRKRRKEDELEAKLGLEAKRQALGTRSIALVGRFVLKEFPRNGVFLGKVVYYDCGLYRVTYEDGDFEDLDSGEVRVILLNDTDFDDDLTRRKGKLEELVSRSNVKAVNKSEKGSDEKNKDEPKVDAPVSSELNGVKGEEQNEGSDDLSSDYDGSDGEVMPLPQMPPLPPPLQLPPSSGSVGVPEQCVSLLFSVYGFLRSFSTRLFLFPFTLDEFVGCLNCRVANNLIDAIHVSLMRPLRNHLESLSLEGSELASKCLRCHDWSLIDALTWPVFVIQYLVVNGHTKGPEWKGFYDEVFAGEYYLLPVSRKLMILQILCDDVLDSEELKAEMNMREESEVGVDYDAEDILPAEPAPRRGRPRSAQTSLEDKGAMKLVSASNAVNQPGNSSLNIGGTGNSDNGDDRNGDDCRLCGMDGTLLCCDGCPSAYHSRCIGVMKMHIPEGLWYCPECKINMAGPTIAKGTLLRGAEIFGTDLYGQLFMGTCDHLLVLNSNSDEFCLKYYNQNDIPNVLQVLYGSPQHRPIYYGICTALMQYWNIPGSFLPLPRPLDEDERKPVCLVNGEYSQNTANLIHSDNTMPSLDASTATTESHAPESSSNPSSKECVTMNMKLPEETKMESVISAGSGFVSVSHQSDVNCQSSANRSILVAPTTCSLINSQYSNYGHANDMTSPMNFSLQTKDSTRVGYGKFESDNNVVYMGFSYKPLSYINYYMHGDFAASAAAKLALVSSEESRLEAHASDSQRKTISANINLQAKAFLLTASRFFWPVAEKKLVEVPRERCGWCFSCKAPVSSKRGCMLNHALISATKSAMKTLAGFSPVRTGEGILPSIATYIIYMEECLRGLIVGPFLSASYRKQWRKQVEQATTYSAIKPLLLELEENIRMIAFCGDWVKLMDDWLAEFSIVQSAAPSLGTAQKRAPSGRRYKKRSANDEVTPDVCHESFEWWRGGKFTKHIFQKAVLPKSLVRKAARQGGLRTIAGISYGDGSEIPKRTRQFVWRVAVQASRTASQLALQVRYLDFYIRWSDLIRPEQNIQDVKGQETDASTFRNANICDRKLIDGKNCYGVAFGIQKHLSTRVMKNVIEIEQGTEGQEKYWFSETRIPLYLVKEYEEGSGNMPSLEEHFNTAPHQFHSRRLQAIRKDIFFYLICKRDNLEMFLCSVCQTGVLLRNALKCNACQGFCHEACSIISTLSINKKVEYLITCNQCYHAKLLAQKETSNESPTSPLVLQGRENSSGTALKGPRPKSFDQTQRSARTKDGRPDIKQVASMTVSKGTKAKCNNQALTTPRSKGGDSDTKQAASGSTTAAKNRRKNCSWGIIWRKKNVDDTGIDFRLKNILLQGGSGFPQLEPVCHLCRKPYRSDLMYIHCETCKHWYHAQAVELEESKIFDVLGFKCCKCRRIKSPECPYSDVKRKTQEGKKTRGGSKKEYSGADSDSGTFSDMKECEPATPIFPVEDDPLLFSLSSVELVTEPKSEDTEWNNLSVPGPQKLPVRRHVKREGDYDGSFGGKPLYSEFSQNEAGNMCRPGELSPSDYDSVVPNDSNLLNDPESVQFEYADFEPHTYFSLTELLPDDSNQLEGADASGDLSGYLGTVVPEECGGVSLVDNSEPAASFQDTVYSCWQCSQMEPAPDLCCEVCGIFIHSQCSPWVESPSRLGSWRCGNCREWQ